MARHLFGATPLSKHILICNQQQQQQQQQIQFVPSGKAYQ